MLACEIVLTGINECAFRYETYNLRSSNAHTPCSGGAADLLEGDMERRNIDVGDVHAHLGNAVFIYIPAYSLAAFERTGYPYLLAVGIFQNLACQAAVLTCFPAFLSYVEGYRHSTAGGGGVEVEINGDEEVTRSHVGGTGSGYALVVGVRTEVGTACRVFHLLRQSLIFALAADCEVAAFRRESGGFVTIAGDAEFIIEAFGERTR